MPTTYHEPNAHPRSVAGPSRSRPRLPYGKAGGRRGEMLLGGIAMKVVVPHAISPDEWNTILGALRTAVEVWRRDARETQVPSVSRAFTGQSEQAARLVELVEDSDQYHGEEVTILTFAGAVEDDDNVCELHARAE
jgi:hypothetical protein